MYIYLLLYIENIAMVKILAKKGADLNAHTSLMETPMILATNNKEMTDELIRLGAAPVCPFHPFFFILLHSFIFFLTLFLLIFQIHYRTCTVL